MSVVGRQLAEWLWPLFDRFFYAGLRIRGEEAAADLIERGNAARKRGLQSTLDSLDEAARLPGGDEARRQAVELFREATLEQARLMQRLVNEPAPAGEAGASLEGPSAGATPSVRSLEGGGQPMSPAKRPVGRPPGSRNKAKVKESPPPGEA